MDELTPEERQKLVRFEKQIAFLYGLFTGIALFYFGMEILK